MILKKLFDDPPPPPMVLLRLILILSFPISSFAQQLVLRGQVIDAKQQTALEFVQVYIPQSSVGTISNAAGNFELELPDSIQADSIVVFVLGYESQRLAIADHLKSDGKIFLQATSYQIDEVEVISKRCKKIKRKTWGPKAKEGLGFFYVALGAQIAVYIPNPKNQLGYLEKVAYYIAPEGIPTTRFRVRVYAADGQNGAPGSDLLHENLIIQAPEGETWVEWDMTSHNIELPENGLFIAMEWLPDQSNSVQYGLGQITGQVLGGFVDNSRKVQEVTWSKDFLSGKWKKHRKNEQQNNIVTALINAKVALCP